MSPWDIQWFNSDWSIPDEFSPSIAPIIRAVNFLFSFFNTLIASINSYIPLSANNRETSRNLKSESGLFLFKNSFYLLYKNE